MGSGFRVVLLQAEVERLKRERITLEVRATSGSVEAATAAPMSSSTSTRQCSQWAAAAEILPSRKRSTMNEAVLPYHA